MLEKTRRHVTRFAFEHPHLTAIVTFLFLAALFNQLYHTTEEAVPLTSFWQMVALGAVMASFGAGLLHDLIRTTRRVAELEMVRTVANTLMHEINNPLQVITSAAELLESLPGEQQEYREQILVHTARIRMRVAQLGGLESRVHRAADPLDNMIDLEHSR